LAPKERSTSKGKKRANSAANNQSSTNNTAKSTKSKLMNTNLILVDDVTGIDQETERDDDELQEGWVPNEAYMLAHGFRKQFGNELTPDLINDMLRDLNRIWRDREKKQLVRLRTQYA
jgi:hypothetical protein